MSHAFFSQAQELLDHDTPFVMALVVRAEKPTSGKPGDKALITADGAVVGWIGGSCSQPKVIAEALKALQDGKSRLIRLSPDLQNHSHGEPVEPHGDAARVEAPRDGLIDLPMTCSSGGTLEIYLEPQYPLPRLLVAGATPITRALISIGKLMDYDVVVVDPEHQPPVEADHLVTHLADIPHYIRPDTYVVVATHGSFDEAALEYVLKTRPRYIGLVASHKRFESVVEYLKEQGIDEVALRQIKAPAGLDIHAQQADEIALSIMAEIIQVRRTAHAMDDWSNRAISVATSSAAAPAVVSGIAIDPVCLMEVEIATAKYTYDYDGKTYYFCAPGCKREFSKNPQEYLKSELATQ